MDEQLTSVSRALLADLDTPVSLGVYLRQKYGEWDDYLAMRVNPLHYHDTTSGALRYFKDAQAVDLLRKYPSLPGTLGKKERRKVAVDGFWATEKQCGLTNERLRPLLVNFGITPDQARLVPFIDKMKRLVARILGNIPLDLKLRFGPGATFESKGHPFAASLTVADKMSMRVASTLSAAPLVDEYVFRSAWGRSVVKCLDKSAPVRVRGNRFTTVDKDATKDRGICIEPGGNVALQLATGRFIRNRLARSGLDLKNGQSLHRALARSGSLSKGWATCDLSSASDTVSLLLVKLLLPEEWYELLFALRSSYSYVDGKWVRLEKFSSMGNGFTFELETLIFAAITSVASGGVIGSNVFVYGDDIIYPENKSREVLAGLRYLGFTPNERKSFSTGPFRESCGGDFFEGFSVRPFLIDKEQHEPSDWISVVNGLRRAADQFPLLGCFRRARNRAIGCLPSPLRRLRGPVVLGDLVIHDHRSTWKTTERAGITYLRVWRPVLRRVRLSRYHPETQMAVALYGSAEGEATNTLQRCLAALNGDPIPISKLTPAYLTPRNGVSGYRFGQVAYS